MKVLLINGSVHKKGCTYTALNIIKQELERCGVSGEIFQVGSNAIPGCNGCGACKKLGKCVYDDVVNEANRLLDDFDAVIVGSPVHFAGPTGVVTAFLDRLFSSSREKLFLKPAAAVVSCRRGGSTATFDQLNMYFTITQMPVISSTYWNQIHGNTPDEVLQDIEGIQTLVVLARNMAYQLKLQEAGVSVGVNRPEPLKKVMTNFIR